LDGQYHRKLESSVSSFCFRRIIPNQYTNPISGIGLDFHLCDFSKFSNQYIQH